MSHYGLKISKGESPDKTPYTIYLPHNKNISERKWTQDYIQFASIDPARKNFALRIERRYYDGRIIPIVFDKTSIELIVEEGEIIICKTFDNLSNFLGKYLIFFLECHFLIIERQLPQNYKATRIAQHTISYLSVKLCDSELLPSIIEVDPKLKGKILGAPKNITDKQLKTWAVERSRELLILRGDEFSINVMNHFKNKQDDLGDTVCMIESLCILWGLLPQVVSVQTTQINKTTTVLPKQTTTNEIVSKSTILPKQSLTELVSKPTTVPSQLNKPINKTTKVTPTQNITNPTQSLNLSLAKLTITLPIKPQ
jgi:hypothetical protein